MVGLVLQMSRQAQSFLPKEKWQSTADSTEPQAANAQQTNIKGLESTLYQIMHVTLPPKNLEKTHIK